MAKMVMVMVVLQLFCIGRYLLFGLLQTQIMMALIVGIVFDLYAAASEEEDSLVQPFHEQGLCLVRNSAILRKLPYFGKWHILASSAVQIRLSDSGSQMGVVERDGHGVGQHGLRA